MICSSSSFSYAEERVKLTEMEALELAEANRHHPSHAGSSRSREMTSLEHDKNVVDPRLLDQGETGEEDKKRAKAEKKQRKAERAQKRALREAREARTALVDHEETQEIGGIPEQVVEPSRKGKRKKQDGMMATVEKSIVMRPKKRKSTIKSRLSMPPPQPSSDPENDPFTSSPVKLPPSSPPALDESMDMDRDLESPVLVMKHNRTLKPRHRNGEESAAKLLFPADQSLVNGSTSKTSSTEPPLVTFGKQRYKVTQPKKVKSSLDSTKSQKAKAKATPVASSSATAPTRVRKKPGRQPNRQTDDELRKAFAKPSAMNEWLASKWVNLAELKRLEDSGVLSYRKGKFNDEEKAAIREHLATFKHMNRLDDNELLEVIHAKGRMSERKEFPKFWPECAAVVPGRPVKYVKDHVKREYDPLARKGPWTPREDEALRMAQQTHPNQWAKISQIVERPELDCRCRWRDELQHRDTRAEGRWDSDEEARLIKFVVELNMSLGQDPYGSEAPWDLVVEKMGGKRTRTQCRKVWQDRIRQTALNQARSAAQGAQVQKAKTGNGQGANIPKNPSNPLPSRIKSKAMVESDDEGA